MANLSCLKAVAIGKTNKNSHHNDLICICSSIRFCLDLGCRQFLTLQSSIMTRAMALEQQTTLHFAVATKKLLAELETVETDMQYIRWTEKLKTLLNSAGKSPTPKGE